MFALWYSLNHIPINYRGLIEKTSHLRPIYLTHKLVYIAPGHAWCIIDKVFASFGHLTHKNLHPRKKVYINWHAQFRIWHVVRGPVHMGSQVPLMEAKVPTFEPQETIKIWVGYHWRQILILLCKTFMGFVLRVGSSFLLNPTLNTSP